MKNIKIVSINTWKCDGNYPVRMRILADQLKNLAPDIIACQECFCTNINQVNTLRFLAHELKMYHAFLPGRFKKRYFKERWVDSASGLGVLSTYPIGEINHFNLPAVVGDEDRKILQTEIMLSPDTTLMLTNTHLTHLNSATNARLAQANALAEVVNTSKNASYHIVCGDFNSAVNSVEMGAFVSTSKAIDCYSAGHGPEPRYSLADAFTKNEKRICVDHIFALPATKTYPDFINSAVVLNEPDKRSGLYASDHFGISTTLVMNNF